ncbi:MAG: helix-turn-helix domain-containing protein, partial [Bacteroidota bacterium]
ALNKENKALRKKLIAAMKSIDVIKTGNIDALIFAHNKDLKIYTEQKADKIYRVLIDKMHEGAVTLNKKGIILYSNSSFATMVCLPLQKVIGASFRDFMAASSKSTFRGLFKRGWQGYSQGETILFTKNKKVIPVLMSVNTLSLENDFVLSIILTDLTHQNRKQAELKSELIEKITNVIIEMNLSDEVIKINYSDYISKKLNYSYSYLSGIFSEVTGISVKQFIIINKIERVKELLLYDELTLTDIAFKLHYSSVAHLSHQFKKVTGLTPTYFKNIKQFRKRITLEKL